MGFTKSVARTGAAHGILVNCVAPGIIETDLLFQTHGREGVEALSRNVPLGLGSCEDIGLSVASPWPFYAALVDATSPAPCSM